MSYTTEQPSSLDFEECCICSEEFSDDNELAAHLLEHAEEEAYGGGANSLSNVSVNGSLPNTPTKDLYPEYTCSTLVKPQDSRANIPNRRPNSPEVLEIDSDSEDETTPLQKRTTDAQSFSSPIKPVQQPQQVQRLSRTPTSQTNIRPQFRMRQSRLLRSSRQLNMSPRPPAPAALSSPFKCTTCNSVFSDPKEFRDHLLTHEKQHPFKCDICSKTFAYKGSLRQHLRQHASAQSHECPHCKKKFTMRSVLKKHCEEIHKIFT